MNNGTIRQRVIFSFAMVLALMMVMGGVALARLSDVEHQTTSLTQDSLSGMYVSSQIMTAVLTNHALTLGHVISVNPAVMKQFEKQRDETRQRLDTLIEEYKATIATAEDRANVEAFSHRLVAYFQVQDQALSLSTALKDEEARVIASTTLHAQIETLRDSVAVIVSGNKQRADVSTRQISQAVSAAELGVKLSAAAALLLAIVFGFLLLNAIVQPLGQLTDALDVMRTGDFSRRVALRRRDEFAALGDGFNRMCDELTTLVGHIRRSGIQVNTSVTEIAATARQQQATANETAATTTEIGATSREISATSKELVRTMKEVAAVADQSALLAGSGQTGLNQMEETMRRVMEATGSINAKLAVLNEKAGNIGQVITTITKVADQTNLLSLNAAIEAEKAGEYGRGFAVVATEIRRLADQTAVSTYDIEQMVKDIQSAVSAGVMGMDRFSEEVRRGMQETQIVGAQLSQIIQQVQAMAPRCEAVNDGMQAQATGAEQITQALAQLSEAAQQTAESLGQSNMAISELNEVAAGLRTGISRFKLEA